MHLIEVHPFSQPSCKHAQSQTIKSIDTTHVTASFTGEEKCV